MTQTAVIKMNRIEQTFTALKSEGRPGLVTFITAGDPDHDTALSLLKSLPAAGADIIELGMPFSDPVADGPIIQLASQRALKAGTTVKSTLEMVRSFRITDPNTPIILMGYYNPIYTYGTERFVEDAIKSGVDGLIVVDLPPEEDEELRNPMQRSGLNLIRLVTPTTDRERLSKITAHASGFLYYVSITGVTGTATPKTDDIAAHIDMIREASSLPVAIGFGIKTPDDAAAMGALADAVVVGSAIVQNIANAPDSQKCRDVVTKQVSDLSKALRSA